MIGGILLLGGDLPGIDGSDTPGEFGFELGQVRATPTTRTPPSELRDATQEAGTAIKETMDELYFRAFVDEGSWGDYAAAFDLFDGRAATRAEADADVLTLGPDANDLYDTLEDANGTLAIAILTDRKDAPVTAIAEVRFEAAARSEGARTTTEIVSVGSFFLRQVDGEWRIFGYRVDRQDVESEAPSPTGSPS